MGLPCSLYSGRGWFWRSYVQIVLYAQRAKNAQHFPAIVDAPRIGQDLQRIEREMVLDSIILGLYLTK